MADIIRKLRLARDLSQADLAALAHTSQPQINRLELSRRELTPKWAARLAPHLGTTAEKLLQEARKESDEDNQYITPLSEAPAERKEYVSALMEAISAVTEIRESLSKLIDEAQSDEARFMLASTIYKAEGVLYRRYNPRANPIPKDDSQITKELFVPYYRPIFKAGESEDILFFPKSYYSIAWRPGNLMSCPNAYAIDVMGEDALPRFCDGELLYVNPDCISTGSRDCVVRLKSGEMRFRRFQSFDNVFYTFKVIRTGLIETIRASDVLSVDAIVGADFDRSIGA